MINVRQIKLEVTKVSINNLYYKVAKKLRIKESDIKELKIFRKSIDARDKNNIYYIYEVSILADNEDKILNLKDNDIYKTPSLEYVMPNIGAEKLEYSPVVVGSGPAGLFTAYILALKGYKPIVIERGEEVLKRVETVNKFWQTGKLNKESNVSFGEGGAGTFSDGKLNTCVSDKNNRIRKVFETFIECGADESILYDYKPHIGTDVLVDVVKKLRNKIIDLGGTFLYNSCLTNIIIENNQVKKIIINNKDEINTNILVLAIGNSARDTFRLLKDLGLNIESKNFAVGFRIIHKQDLIDESQFGNKYASILSPATYKLTYQASNNRAVYSFCMCPGGYVVNSSSEDGKLAINGMSYFKRNSGYANSAIVVSVRKDDFKDPIEFQRDIEKKAHEVGNGKIPVQTLKDFYNNEVTDNISISSIKGNYQYSNLNNILPGYLTNSIKQALRYFDTKIKGFASDDAVLCAVESRTSSPIRINRDLNYESNIKGIYPCGEGAGYAGGITSSAVDGIKVAEAIISKYRM